MDMHHAFVLSDCLLWPGSPRMSLGLGEADNLGNFICMLI